MGNPKQSMLYTAAAALLFTPAAATFKAIGAIGGRKFNFDPSRKRRKDGAGMTGGLKKGRVTRSMVLRANAKKRNVARHRTAVKRARASQHVG